MLWSAPNNVWLEVVGSPNGSLCPNCFHLLYMRGRDGKSTTRDGCHLFWECAVGGFPSARQSSAVSNQCGD